MPEHTRFSRFVTKLKDRGQEREERSFERQKLQLERKAELEKSKADIRKSEAMGRPTRTGGGQSFGRRFVETQQSFFRPATNTRRLRVKRTIPRVAAQGRTFFDQFGRPISVRNAPAVRRARKKRKITQLRPETQNLFAPSGLV